LIRSGAAAMTSSLAVIFLDCGCIAALRHRPGARSAVAIKLNFVDPIGAGRWS
jgi:hypothetical protein